MEDERVTPYFRLGRYGSQAGEGLPLLQCWVPLSVCFSSVFGMDGPFRSTKQGGLQADVGKIPATVKH